MEQVRMTAVFAVKDGHLTVELPLDDPRAFAEGVRASLKLMEHLERGKEDEV